MDQYPAYNVWSLHFTVKSLNCRNFHYSTHFLIHLIEDICYPHSTPHTVTFCHQTCFIFVLFLYHMNPPLTHPSSLDSPTAISLHHPPHPNIPFHFSPSPP